MPDYIVGIVGYSPSEDGTQHAVYLDCAGRQFIVDGRGRRRYGIWYVPAGEEAGRPQERNGAAGRNGDHRGPHA